jgi:hypothetical protein
METVVIAAFFIALCIIGFFLFKWFSAKHRNLQRTSHKNVDINITNEKMLFEARGKLNEFSITVDGRFSFMCENGIIVAVSDLANGKKVIEYKESCYEAR